MRIGILEDTPEHARLLERLLEQGGHSCRVHATRARFLQSLARESFDLLILDWMLPDASGIEVLEEVRERAGRIPVLFVTSRDAEEDIVEALQRGADDYLVKPPRAGELLARVEALRRRSEYAAPERTLEVPPYRFDLEARQAQLGETPIALTSRQFDLAVFLFRQPGRLFSRVHLLEAVWGVGSDVQTRTLDIHISQLRGALCLTPDNGWRIGSVYGHGYRLERIDVGD